MPDPKTSWFPVGRENTDGWRLDVVSILAILGESLMAGQIQPISASRLCLLPRLLPAPQSFLKYSRELRLPSHPAVVCGVHSGALVHQLNYFADILLPISGLKRYQVEVYRITWAHHAYRLRYTCGKHIRREALVPPRRFSPVNILTVLSSGLTIGAITWAMAIRDGAAVFALSAMSLASTLVGAACYWKPRLVTRPTGAPVPDGDVVIRTRNGALVVVRCSEEIARELYMATEDCDYMVNDQWAKVLLGCGTLLVIASVIFLGNCSWTMQVVIAVIYVKLNAIYWVASLLPPKWLWDLSRYILEKETPENLKGAHEYDAHGNPPNYTRSLWYTIQATGQVDWISISDSAPRTPAWKTWLDEAYANRNNIDWDPVMFKDHLMGEARRNTIPKQDVTSHRRQEETSHEAKTAVN